MIEKTPHSQEQVRNLNVSGFLAEEWTDAFTQIESTIRETAEKYRISSRSVGKLLDHIEGHLIDALNIHTELAIRKQNAEALTIENFLEEAIAELDGYAEEFSGDILQENNGGDEDIKSFFESIRQTLVQQQALVRTESQSHPMATIEDIYPIERRTALVRNTTLKVTLNAKEYDIATTTRDAITDHLKMRLIDNAGTADISIGNSTEQAQTPPLAAVANSILKEYILSNYDAIAQENKGNLDLHAFISSIVSGLEEGWWKNISNKT